MRNLLALAGVATAFLAVPASAQTHLTYGPLNCVYDRLGAQRARVDVDNIDSDANARLLNSAFEPCAVRHKWPAELLLIVITHLNARLSHERAEAQIVRAGGKAGAVANVWHAMTDEERSLARGSDEQAGTILRRRAPDLFRFGAPAVTSLAAYAEMKFMERAWGRIAPDG